MFFCTAAWAHQMELFTYWVENAGDDYFGGGLPGMIRKRLKERDWQIHPLGLDKLEKGALESDYWVLWSFGAKAKKFDLSRLPKEKLALFLWEPPTVEIEGYDPQVQARFGKIFTWDDDLVDNVKFFKFHYPVLQPRIEKIPAFKEKKFCTLVATRLSSKFPKSLYQEREKTIRFFEDKRGEFDLYGRNWEKRKFKNYRGAIGDKIAVLKEYKFCICYENTRDMKGYITEKIFDCFAAGCVPIYWGASNVTDYIPAETFIDRRKFSNVKRLYMFLKSLSQDDYQKYLDAAAAFLKSEKAQVFSNENFVNTFIDHLTTQKPSS